MTDKRLRKMNRRELLELLVRQQEENENLQVRIAELEKEAENRSLAIGKAGSLAEAALMLNDIFADADRAVALYKRNAAYCSEFPDTLPEAPAPAAEEVPEKETASPADAVEPPQTLQQEETSSPEIGAAADGTNIAQSSDCTDGTDSTDGMDSAEAYWSRRFMKLDELLRSYRDIENFYASRKDVPPASEG